MIGNQTRFFHVFVLLCAIIATLHTGRDCAQAATETILDVQLPFVSTSTGDQNGCRIDISYDTVIVGGRFGGAGGEGSVQVFYRDLETPEPLATAWNHQATLTTSDPTLSAGEKFGDGVGIDQDMAVVGASGNNTVYVYRRTGQTWTPDATPWFSMESIDNFGVDVQVSGERIIVGSADNAAYVFTKQAGIWEGTPLTASGTKANFGSSVDISGTSAIVGDLGANTAYLYHLSGGSWIEDAAFSMTSGDFGTSVSIYGDYAIVGASSVNSGTGLATIYHRDAGTWTEQATLTASDGLDGELFGCSVDIRENFAIVGAMYGFGSNFTYDGTAYIFQRDGSTWTEVDKLVPEDEWDYDYPLFGSDVALSESTEIANLVVGASYYDSETGTAYAHQLAMPDLYQNDPIPGDANLDKIVNDLDATILAANWQKATGALWGDGDFDEDGDVDDVDATILAVNWLRTADASATSIPEPHALLILAIGTLCLSLSRVRRF